jgi:5-methylcytosine-specific restriction endonuclease McrA
MTRCAWCGTAFRPRTRTSRFCSKSCAGKWQWREHPRRVHTWGKRPSVDNNHRRLRAALLPPALGTGCPLCGQVITAANADLDHIVPRALGGQSVPGNVRIVCRWCNRKRGQQLGGQQATRHPRPW